MKETKISTNKILGDYLQKNLDTTDWHLLKLHSNYRLSPETLDKFLCFPMQ